MIAGYYKYGYFTNDQINNFTIPIGTKVKFTDDYLLKDYTEFEPDMIFEVTAVYKRFIQFKRVISGKYANTSYETAFLKTDLMKPNAIAIV